MNTLHKGAKDDDNNNNNVILSYQRASLTVQRTVIELYKMDTRQLRNKGTHQQHHKNK
jgi:hypothetical protein